MNGYGGQDPGTPWEVYQPGGWSGFAKQREENKFRDLAKYFQQFQRAIYGDIPLLSGGESTMFEEKAASIEKRSKELEAAAISNLGARGMMRGGVGSEFIEQHVTTPTAEAYSELDTARAALEAERREGRRSEAMGYAAQKYQEEQQKRGGFGRFLGKVFGTAAGVVGGLATGGMSIAPGIMGAAGGIGALFGSGGQGGGVPGFDPMMMMMLKFLQQNPNATFDMFNKNDTTYSDTSQDTTLPWE